MLVPPQPHDETNNHLPPLVDGFTLSMNQLYLPTTYRSSALYEMEALRRANSYRTRWYPVPDSAQATIPAYGQLEAQVSSIPGSYLWGLIFYAPFTSGNFGAAPLQFDYSKLSIQITDACTETPLFADYTCAWMFRSSWGGVFSPGPYRNPCLISPRLLGNPAKLNVEIYNGFATAKLVQLVLFIAEPMITPEETEELLRKQGVQL